MTRRSSLPAGLLFAGLVAGAATPLAAQVGYPPAESPYEDLRGRQAVTLSPGWLVPGGDPAGVGPRSGLLLSGRYELFLSGPLWLVSRIGYAPGLERTVKDPEAAPALRIVGTETDPLYLADVGLGLNLTGNKSWHRIAPRATVNLGVASTLNDAYDVGGYRFGTKFVASYGVGTRIVSGSKWELNTELTHLFWQMKYPDSYGSDGSATDESILGLDKLAAWKGNLMLTVGVSRYFFR